MDSFDGSRRRDPRPPLPPAERRSPREPEPLDQRLDRWVSTGRQLVEGVAGGRPGSRRSEGRAGSRGGFDGLGRWVEDRLDWLLDDSDDWPEPWQQSERRRNDPPTPAEANLARQPEPAADRRERSRRPLQAISRRGMGATDRTASGRDSRATRDPAAPAPSQPLSPSSGRSDPAEEWPDDQAFSVPRWQRPAPPLRRPDPLQTELEQRGQDQGPATPPGQGARPLPRSSRRR